MIALAYLKQHPSKWNIYVANCVSEVQTSLPNIMWNYVSSKLADVPHAGCQRRRCRHITYSGTVSLGSSVPPLFSQHDPAMSIDATIAQEISETRKSTAHHVDCASECELPHEYSSWIRLIPVIA
jgi:hypothetical protein